MSDYDGRQLTATIVACSAAILILFVVAAMFGALT